MTDLTLKPTFIDRGGKQVYDVILFTKTNSFENLGQVRIAPDPRIAESEEKADADCEAGWHALRQERDNLKAQIKRVKAVLNE